MVLPFEVRAVEDSYFCLLILRQAPSARKVYRSQDLRAQIVSYLGIRRFADLNEAILAALAERRPRVHLLRNVTLPGPQLLEGSVNALALRCHVWCVIPAGASVTLLSKGGQWRLRHACKNSRLYSSSLHSLFVIKDGARLSIKGIRFEAILADYRFGRYLATVGHTRHAGVLELADDVSTDGYAQVVNPTLHESPWKQRVALLELSRGRQ
eukprot:TRINITY_DN35475_c0_g1_i1.p1 TRINITY_DN35475_c0_g1~~TRINITY_DN35475_c0_g1_i1.p1  ORF type:complete len:211 (+),score=2.77 TRINITY_DN35475_c0_g1_i1:58-690(+)